jgi:hypothetical protein
MRWLRWLPRILRWCDKRSNSQIPRTEIESGQTREIILTAFGASSSSERYHLTITSTGVAEVDLPGKCGSLLVISVKMSRKAISFLKTWCVNKAWYLEQYLSKRVQLSIAIEYITLIYNMSWWLEFHIQRYRMSYKVFIYDNCTLIRCISNTDV